MIIRKLIASDAETTSDLICRVFNEFVAIGWTEKAIQYCLSEQSTEKIIERSKDRDQYIALSPDNKVMGVIEGKNNFLITRLFVDTGFQKQGIATKLIKKIEEVFIGRGSKKIVVHSSLYAQNFYKKMGYKKSTRLIKSKGTVYQPMIKYL